MSGPTDTVTVYVPTPSNCSSGPAATMSPAVPFRPTQNGVAFEGWVGRPSGTPLTVSATRWKPDASSR